EAEPAQRVLDLLRRLSDLAARVGVLDPQPELAAVVTGEEPVEQGRTNVPDVQKPRRARCHPHSDRSSHWRNPTTASRPRHSPRTWRFPSHDPKDLEQFRERRKEIGLPALVHSLYLVNLAAPDKDVYRKSVDTMRATVDAACAIDAYGVVFHVGSHLGAGFEA